jgi:hypothetical protein
MLVASRAMRATARRMERLAGDAPHATDERSDEREPVATADRGVHRAADVRGVQRAGDTGAADARVAEYAALLDEVAGTLSARIEEAELPLHILL